MGPDGKPLADSLKSLYEFLSKNFGKNTHVSPTDYPGRDFKAANTYAEEFMKNHPPYSIINNNCKTFARKVASGN
jgi:hypothetical protein